MKKWHRILIWAAYFVAVDIGFDLIQYLFYCDLFNRWYFFLSGFILFSLGWLGCWLDYKLEPIKNLRKKSRKKK